jgi:hypothetical protein
LIVPLRVRWMPWSNWFASFIRNCSRMPRDSQT